MTYKTRWARNGAVIGIMLLLPDLLFEWRGPMFLPWTQANFIAQNLGIFGGATLGGAFIGMLCGACKDGTAITMERFGIVFRSLFFLGAACLAAWAFTVNRQKIVEMTAEDLAVAIALALFAVWLIRKAFRPSPNPINRRRWAWSGITLLGTMLATAIGVVGYVVIDQRLHWWTADPLAKPGPWEAYRQTVDVTAPNGAVVSFPAGTDAATINAEMMKRFGGATKAPPLPPGFILDRPSSR